MNASKRIVLLLAGTLLATSGGLGPGRALGEQTPAGLTLTVTSSEDTEDLQWGDGVCGDEMGRCTLRGAIQEANGRDGADTIRFHVGSGAVTLKPASAYPVIYDPVTIDGTTQPGFSGSPAVLIDGSGAGAGADGLVMAGKTSVVRAVAITAFDGIGVVISDADDCRLEGSFVGLALDGRTAAGNHGHGVHVLRARRAVIGGTELAQRNVIAGNGSNGVDIAEVGAREVRVLGNFIGTDALGETAVPNGVDGVAIQNAPGNTVGGAEPGAANLISGNRDDGVDITGPGAISNTVQANWIGTRRDGTTALGNEDSGVVVLEATDALIAGNVVAGNAAIGVELAGGARRNRVRGNWVGVSPALPDGVVPNGAAGIALDGAAMNDVGGIGPAAVNQVAGNGAAGILLTGTRTRANRVTGNVVGRFGGVRAADAGGGIVLESGASANEVRANDVADGVRVTGSGTDDNRLAGNIVRPGPKAPADMPFDALALTGGVQRTTVVSNTVSGSWGAGVRIRGSDTRATTVISNVITGSLGAGIVADGALLVMTGNVVAASGGDGVVLTPSSEGALLEANIIGVAEGWPGNGGAGIRVAGMGHRVGAAMPDPRPDEVVRNLIAGNAGPGISVDEGVGHALWADFEANGGLPIDLGGDGPTANDDLDTDNGPNTLLNYPLVRGAALRALLHDGAFAGYRLSWSGEYGGAAGHEVWVHLYALATCPPENGTAAATFVGVAARVAGTSTGPTQMWGGAQPFSAEYGGVAVVAVDDEGNTSEMSPCTPVLRSAYLPATVR